MDTESDRYDLLTSQKQEVLKLLKTTTMTTAELFGMSLLIGTPEDAALVVHELERDGSITMQAGLWRSAHTREPVRDIARKCSLLERMALLASDDIADTLREIAGDLAHCNN